MAALGFQMQQVPGVTITRAEVNGQPGAVVRDAAGALVNVFSFEIADGVVQTVWSVINRDKLRHLGPLADLPALLELRRASAPS
jgi:RNA polymerase sigma-70 factor, ECF subfamily